MHAKKFFRSVARGPDADLGTTKAPLRGPCNSSTWCYVVGLTRIELVTSSLSGMRSNRLSYSPSGGLQG